MLVIGFDSEYVRRGDTNEILSYQFAIKTKDKLQTGIFYPKTGVRWSLAELLEKVIHAGREAKTLDRVWPDELYLVAHFSRADVAMFKDYKELSRQFDNLRGSYATLGKPLRQALYDKNRNKHTVQVHLRDTMTIAPGGSSLASLGELLDLPKIDIPAGAIEAMDTLLKTDKQLFERYAIRDAEIAAEFAWKLAEFNRDEGLTFEIPLTLGSLAVKLLEDLWEKNGIKKFDVLGKEVSKQQTYSKGRYRTVKTEVPLQSVHLHEALATECYHGGRNEAYHFGPTDQDFWTDVDLSGAYSTAMAAIRMPDWNKLCVSNDVNAFTADVLGVANVSFKFPDDCLFPCLPVRTDNGLIFPLEGKSNCGSPEIALALKLGAKVEVLHGVIVPWASGVRPFEILSQKVREKRKSFKKGSVFERTWKEIGNSLYGKVAQGLRKKRVFDSRNDESTSLPPSKVTQPYLAAYITSIVRAVLGELLTKLPPGKVNISATTDGFITNATRSELDLSGPLCTFFADQAERLTGERAMIEVKHVVQQVICMKTRGQLTAGILDYELKPIKAKAGVQVPKGAFKADARQKEHSENDWMLELFLTRTAETTVSSRQLTSMREMHLKDEELLMLERDKKVGLEFDWKRELIDPEMKFVGQVICGENHSHIACGSKPHRTVEDFQMVRQQFDKWRRTNTLRTMEDWANWVAFRVRKTLKAQGATSGHGDLEGQCKRQFLRAFANNDDGIKDCTYVDLAAWMTGIGYGTTPDDVKNAKRTLAAETDWSLVNDAKVRKLLEAIATRYNWPKV